VALEARLLIVGNTDGILFRAGSVPQEADVFRRKGLPSFFAFCAAVAKELRRTALATPFRSRKGCPPRVFWSKAGWPAEALAKAGRVFCHAIEQRRHFRRHLKVPEKSMGPARDMSPESSDRTPESFPLSPATLEATDDASLEASHPAALVDAWAALFLRPPGLHVIRAAEMNRQLYSTHRRVRV
jgi:hypothetical protein